MNADLTSELYFLQFRIREIDDCLRPSSSPTALVSDLQPASRTPAGHLASQPLSRTCRRRCLDAHFPREEPRAQTG